MFRINYVPLSKVMLVLSITGTMSFSFGMEKKMESDIIYDTKVEAKEAGGKFYRAEKTCGKGHEKAVRYVSSGMCIMCAAAKNVTGKPRRVNYLNNKDMLAEVIASQKAGKMSPTLANMMMLLTKRYAKKGNFAYYSYNDDMQSHALLNICKAWDKFNPEKSNNPFAYYTQFIKNAFVQFINKEAKHTNLCDKLAIDAGATPSWSCQVDHEMAQRMEREEKKRLDVNAKILDAYYRKKEKDSAE